MAAGLLVGWWFVTPRYFFRTFRIPSAGMEPALRVGSHVIVRVTKNVRAGDMLVFHYPIDPRVLYVKRLVGAPGDTVEIRDKRLIVNGRERTEPYVIHVDPVVYPLQPALPEPYRSRDQYGPYRVPDGSYFVLGDNRDRSSDSRYWGVVPQGNVIGRVVYVIKPF